MKSLSYEWSNFERNLLVFIVRVSPSDFVAADAAVVTCATPVE